MPGDPQVMTAGGKKQVRFGGGAAAVRVEAIQQLRVPEDILSCSHDYPLKSNRPPCL